MIKYGVICLLTLMYAPVHVMCMQRGVSIGICSDVIEYTEALARKDWPRFRDPFDIPLPESKMVVYTLAKQGSIGMRISLVIQKSYLSICSRCRGE
jgi:hypothetical protein